MLDMQYALRNTEHGSLGFFVNLYDDKCNTNQPVRILQETSTGQIKVIERYDCSGAGDVDTSTVVTAEVVDGKRVIPGRSGRKLVVSSISRHFCHQSIFNDLNICLPFVRFHKAGTTQADYTAWGSRRSMSSMLQQYSIEC